METAKKSLNERYRKYTRNVQEYHEKQVAARQNPEEMCLQVERRADVLKSITDVFYSFTENPARVLSAFAEFEEKERKQGLPSRSQLQDLTAALISLSSKIEDIYEWSSELTSELNFLRNNKVADMTLDDGEL